jgi:hypothetical protein
VWPVGDETVEWQMMERGPKEGGIVINMWKVTSCTGGGWYSMGMNAKTNIPQSTTTY